MAYDVSEKFKQIIYSGDVKYDCKLYFGDFLVPVEQIVYIKISSPIIDVSETTGKYYHIGTFASQKIEIKFRNLNNLNIENNPEVRLTIGVLTDEETMTYEYVPIGEYLIDELDENYQKTCIITCLDYAVIMKTPLDISQFFDHVELVGEGEEQKQVRFIYAIDLFTKICNYYGLNSTVPSLAVNRSKKIYQYDDTITGKQYISYLAELFGGNAKITRDKFVTVGLLNSEPVQIINALTSKEFEVGQTYEICRVVYEAGKIKYYGGKNIIYVDELPTESIDTNSYYFLASDQTYYAYENEAWVVKTDMKNTLYLRPDNLFITSNEEVQNIYNAVNGVKITNLKCENRMDISLDAWDKVEYTDGENSYVTFYDNTITYNGVTMGKNEVKIPFIAQKETTNIITNPLEQIINRVRVLVNEQTGEITSISEQVGGISSQFTQLPERITSIVRGEAITKDDFDGYKKQLITEMSQTMEGWTMEWSKTEEKAQDAKDTADNNKKELQEYIRFVDGHIILGKAGNELTLDISNDRISFLQNNAEVAYMSNNTLYIVDGNFLNSLRIGNFAFIPRSNGSLDFKFVGGA